MTKHFLTVLHEGEVMKEASLEMLKGGQGDAADCPKLTSCGCYQGYGCISNKVDPPKPTDPPKPIDPTKPYNPNEPKP